MGTPMELGFEDKRTYVIPGEWRLRKFPIVLNSISELDGLGSRASLTGQMVAWAQ